MTCVCLNSFTLTTIWHSNDLTIQSWRNSWGVCLACLGALLMYLFCWCRPEALLSLNRCLGVSLGCMCRSDIIFLVLKPGRQIISCLFFSDPCSCQSDFSETQSRFAFPWPNKSLREKTHYFSVRYSVLSAAPQTKLLQYFALSELFPASPVEGGIHSVCPSFPLFGRDLPTPNLLQPFKQETCTSLIRLSTPARGHRFKYHVHY